MTSETTSSAMSEKATGGLVPKLRFPEFREQGGWKIRQLGDFLQESRVPGNKGNVARKITVKLWGKGVFEKNEAIQGSANTQYYRRKAGQFIYSKLDFLNQAFGIIPPNLDQFESTVDLALTSHPISIQFFCLSMSSEKNSMKGWERQRMVVEKPGASILMSSFRSLLLFRLSPSNKRSPTAYVH